MFGKSFKLFKLLGFTVSIDLSWFIIGLLIAWSLANGVFPQMYPDLSKTTYWTMGVIGAGGLFFSIVFHELCHSVIARHYGLPMGGITLFIFGGVAQMTEEPDNPKTEFLMAIAGPISSGVLGGLFLMLTVFTRIAQLDSAITGIFLYLTILNLLLAGFNLFPGFPLDGGRILRSILWYFKNDLRWATRIATSIGSGFGMALILMGVFRFIFGDIIAGLWSFLIGIFIRNAARSAFQQLLLRETLSGATVAHFMNDHPITVTPDTSIEQLVENYIYHYHHKVYPVMEGDTLYGLVHSRQVRDIPRDQWTQRRVSEIMDNTSSSNTIKADEDALTAFSQMNKTKASRIMVVDDEGRLKGIISLKDLMDFFSFKLEIEEGTSQNPISASRKADV